MRPDGDGGESLNTFLSKKGHISTWMLILDADPAFACINMPLTFRVLNISPMYHGTEMVMSRSLQMMMLSPLKRWGEGITVKQKTWQKHFISFRTEVKSRNNVVSWWWHEAAPPHCYFIIQVRDVPRKASFGISADRFLLVSGWTKQETRGQNLLQMLSTYPWLPASN